MNRRLLYLALAISITIGVVFGTQLFYKNKIGQAQKEIVMVEIDQTTIEKMGRWPYERAVFGMAIEKLSRNGAVIIAINILFMEDSSKEDDNVFRNAIEKNKNVVLPILKDEPAFLKEAGAIYGALPFYPDEKGIIKDIPTYDKDMNMPTITAMAAKSFLCPNECLLRKTILSLQKPPNNFEKLSLYRLFEMSDIEVQKSIKNKIVVVGVNYPDSFDVKQTTWSDKTNSTDLLAIGISTMIADRGKIFERNSRP